MMSSLKSNSKMNTNKMGSVLFRQRESRLDMTVPGTLVDIALSLERMQATREEMSFAQIASQLSEEVFMPRIVRHLEDRAPEISVHIVALFESLTPEEQRPVSTDAVFESQPYRLVKNGDDESKDDDNESNSRAPPSESKEDEKCPICLGEFQDEEMVIVLPHCSHIFHTLCIKEWMKRASSCPTCRAPMN